MPELTEGTVVGDRYTVVSRLGSGGMADVYLANDSELGRKVALKVLHRRFASDPEFVARFRLEAEAAAGLQHPNVVSVYDRGDWEGTSYIAMEYLPGRTLKELIREEAPLAPQRAVHLGIQIARAAQFAHAGSIVHRDLKPQNVMVSSEDRATVTDFGIARAGASGVTEVGSIMGTAHYISPEQAQGQEAGPAADIYSIGIVLYEMLTGQVPFDAESPVAIALKQVTAEAPAPSALVPTVPADLDAVVLWALRKNAAERPADAGELIKALDQVGERLRAEGDASATVAFTGAPATQVSPSVPVGAPADGLIAGAALGARRERKQDSANRSAAAPPQETEDGAQRKWLIAGGVAAALTIALGFAAMLGAFDGAPQRTMPLVVGLELQIATTNIANQGFTEAPTIQRVQSSKPKDQVIKQNPLAGDRAAADQKITLTVSDGPGTVQIPTVADLPAADAKRTLEKLGFKVAVKEKASTDVKKGNAISTDPAAGLSILKGSQITLFVSSGVDQVVVQSVIGQLFGDARSSLQAQGFVVPAAQTQVSSQPPGTVLSQSPEGGTKADKGSIVVLTVSAPWVTVPDVTGMSQAAATSALQAEGFKVTVTGTPGPTATVLSQSPSASSDVPKGSTVTITLGP
ncbi:MAG: Stk1 family PASTA domain-containing Ser/Thr kinase [Solirubrobacterales bacterium]|nr:Stk1 family PASTA domain-containing Ser/Thr kinase [Solirubrobacterales bacterium]